MFKELVDDTNAKARKQSQDRSPCLVYDARNIVLIGIRVLKLNVRVKSPINKKAEHQIDVQMALAFQITRHAGDDFLED
jgi:hypothetical protein